MPIYYKSSAKVVIVTDGKRTIPKPLYLSILMPGLSQELIFYFFLFFAVTQALYWLYFIIGVFRVKKVNTESGKSTEVSIVVAAQNEIHNLRALVPNLLKQEHENYEIIIVNDRSEDGTLEFLLDIEKQHDNFKGINIHDRPEHINSKKYALTLGIKAAKYPNILLTDADCLPVSNQWVSSMACGFISDNNFVLGFSNYSRLKGFLNYFIRFETLITGLQYLGSAGNNIPYMGVGRNLGYKKEPFLRNKGFIGFQELIGGDDDILVNKYAEGRLTQVILGEHAVINSDPKTTWKTFLRQKHRHLSVGKHYRSSTKFWIGLFNISWILTYLLAGLLFTLHYDPIYVGAVLAGRFLVMIGSIIAGTKRIGITFEWLGVVILDLIYPFYYIFAGTKAALFKTISWE